MIQYTPTPDYYNEYIQHGWLKDQAAKAHKYIERWRGKNGKWYYRYKSKAQEVLTKFNRHKLLKNWNSTYQDPGDKPRKRNADEITTNYGKKMLMRWDNGKPKSYWQKENSGNPIFNQKSLDAARKRAGVKVKKSRSKKNEYKRMDTAFRYLSKRKQKMEDKVNKVNKAIRNIDTQLTDLNQKASRYHMESKQQLLKTPTQRYNAKTKEKKINEQIKALKKRRKKLDTSINGSGSLNKYHKNYSAYSTWNR